MSNRFFLPKQQLDTDMILPNSHTPNTGSNTTTNNSSNRSLRSTTPLPSSSSSSVTTAAPSISSLLSSIRTLHQTAIQRESQLASSTHRTSAVVAVVHAGAPPPPVSVTQPPISFRTGRPMKQTTKSKTKATTKTNSTAAPTSSTDQWYYMRSTPMTSELKMDLNILQNRNYLDPKRFYKSSSLNKKHPGVVQVGTVIEGSHEYYTHRYTQQERSQTLLQEVMKDRKIHHYTTQTYKTMQQQHTIKAQQQQQQHRRTKSSTKKPIFKKTQHRK
jgi:Fcf2 pre-rRNA processing